jgi:hypothetical protein
MSSELVYTSAGRGLNPNTSGFCTVGATEGLSRPVQTRLESLSGYEFRFNLSDPNAAMNPVNFAHTRLAIGTETRSILSRIAFSGADYSGRTNKIAHHFVLDAGEQMAAGPAWMLGRMARGVLRNEWAGEPRSLPRQRLDTLLAGGQGPAGPAAAWQKVTGDAGWAGMLAKAYADNPDVPAFVLFSPGTDLLPLFEESLAILPPTERWNVCFATYYTVLPAGCQYHWRGVLAGSPAQQEIKRFTGATVIDLTNPLGPAETNEFTEAARAGRMADLRRGAKSRPAAVAVPPVFGSAATVSVGTDDDAKLRLPDPDSPDLSPRPPATSYVPVSSNVRAPRPSNGAKVVMWVVIVLLAMASAVLGWQFSESRKEVADLKNEKETLSTQVGKSGDLARKITGQAQALQAQAAQEAQAANTAAQMAEQAANSSDLKKMEEAILEARSAATQARRSAENARKLAEILSDDKAKDAKIAADGALAQAAQANDFAEKAAACRNLVVALVNPAVTQTRGTINPVKTGSSVVTPTAPVVTPTVPTKNVDPPVPVDVAMTAPLAISRDEFKTVIVRPVVNEKERVIEYQVEASDAFVNKLAKDALPQEFAGFELKYADKQLKVFAASISGFGTGQPLITCRVVGTPGKHVLQCTFEDEGKKRQQALKWFVLEVVDTTKKIIYQCPMVDRPKMEEKTFDVGFQKGPYQIGVWNRDAKKMEFQGRDGMVVPIVPADGLKLTYPWMDKLAAFATADENGDRRSRLDPKLSNDLGLNDPEGAKPLTIYVHIDSQSSKDSIELTPKLATLTLDSMEKVVEQAWQNSTFSWGQSQVYLVNFRDELPRVNKHIEEVENRLKGRLNDDEKKKAEDDLANSKVRKKFLEDSIPKLEPQVTPTIQMVREFMDAANRVINKGGLHMVTVRDPWGLPVARMTLKFTPGDVEAFIWKQAPKNPVPPPPKDPPKDPGKKKPG